MKSIVAVEMIDNINGESQIELYFERTRNIIQLKYNLVGTNEFTESIQIDKRLKLRELRKELAQRLNLPYDKFKLRRGNIRSFEFKNEEDSLQQICLHDGAYVFIEEGIPLRPDEYSLCVFQYKAELVEDPIIPLFDVAIREQMTILELKQQLVSKLNIPADRMRLRERFGQRVGKIYLNEHTLKNSFTYLYDGKEIVVEEIKAPEHLEDDDIVLLVQLYMPEKSKFTEKTEMIFKQNLPMHEFQQQLAQLYIINKEHLYCVKPWQNDVNIEIIPHLKWETFTSDSDQKTLSTSFWSIRDGDLILCKDGQVEDNITKQTEQTTANTVHSYRQPTYQIKERALKIHTPNFDQREKKEERQIENGDKTG